MHSNNQHILWKPGISGTAEEVNFFIPPRPDPQSNSVLNCLVWRVSLLEKYRGERIKYKYQEYGMMVRKVHVLFGKGGYSLGTGR
jgi:hypothetical protein